MSTLNLTEPNVQVYHFDGAGATGAFVSTATSGREADFTAGDEKGVEIEVDDGDDYSFCHFGDNLVFNIDRLMSIEYLAKIEDWDSGTAGYLGVASAVNADPDVIANAAWFKIGGGSNNRNLNVESDDGTNDLSASAGIEVADDSWLRLLIDFRSGIQSIGPPGVSKPGKGSLQFTASNSSGQQIHVNKSLTSHIDMSNYAGGLQPFFGMTQTGNASTAVHMYVKQIRVVAEQPR